MKSFSAWMLLCLLVSASLCAAAQQPMGSRREAAEELFALANQSRAQSGAGPLKWDRALADAAFLHCERMVQEGEISHRYGGEPDLTARAAASGAHFSLIEENIALGPHAARIHQGWLASPGHRRNLLNPEVDRVGIAVIESRGDLYAVADYAQAVAVLSTAQVEGQIAGLIHMGGVEIRRDPHDARLACAEDRGIPGGATGPQALFVMRWQGADLDHLPQDLVNRLGTGRYRSAEVGACPAHSDQGGFTVYRLAVLLY
ncbi:MAG TPA: CAP domain-containing protein [Terracidiphilus sp.]